MATWNTSQRTFTAPSEWTGASWKRLEGSSRAPTLEPGLQARVADPLWLLHRQWQLGEFKGEDAANPVQVSVETGTTELSTFHHRADARGRVRAVSYALGVPLETVAERQEVESGHAAWGLAAEAGMHALRLLDAYGVGDHRGALRQEATLPRVPPDPLIDETDQRRIRILRRSGVDGRRLSQAIDGASGSASLVARLAIPESDRAAFIAALDEWKEWYQNRFSTPGESPPSWSSRRMEHGFQVSAPTGENRRVSLAAEEYPGGHLDWWAFDVAPGSRHDGAARDGVSYQTDTLRSVPTPVRYHGMPADRFWEREEGEVWFGGLQGGPADLARLVVAEFATIYGDDWFLAPVGADVGSLVRVNRLTVTDTFGRTKPVPSAAEIDGPQRVFRLFELDGDAGPNKGVAPWVFVAPTLAEVDHGREVERVVFTRDEGANVAWAIEQMVENVLGRGVRRRDAWLANTAAGGEPDRDRDGQWRYTLQSTVPPHWVPLLPVRIRDSSETHFRRGRMQQWEDLLPALGPGPLSEVLEPDRVLRVREEEVPREGIRVVRRWQLTRWVDGSVHLWMGRRKQVGRGERSSGLRFDVLDRGGKQ